jgi:cytochrome b involved in lipid metabolism
VIDFADRHPGGRDFLLVTAARDATAMFKSLHDPKAIKVLVYVRAHAFALGKPL